MIDERSDLTRTFAKLAHNHSRDAVINAAGNMVINAIRQSHRDLPSAERELADLVQRMRAALRENHYDSNGQRRVTNIVIPPLEHLLGRS
jgi:hypothetical protein